MKSVNFDNLVGEAASLYYCNNLNQFQLGSVIFEVIEDEEDGYRSSMSEVNIVNRLAQENTRDFLADVIIAKVDEIYQIIDITDGHIWYEFGTNTNDDYYPWFIFKYNLKSNLKQLIK